MYALNCTWKYQAAICPAIYAPSQAPTMRTHTFTDTRGPSEPSSIDGNRCHSGIATNATDASRGCGGTADTRIAVIVPSWSCDSAHSQQSIVTTSLSVQSTYRKERLEVFVPGHHAVIPISTFKLLRRACYVALVPDCIATITVHACASNVDGSIVVEAAQATGLAALAVPERRVGSLEIGQSFPRGRARGTSLRIASQIAENVARQCGRTRDTYWA